MLNAFSRLVSHRRTLMAITGVAALLVMGLAIRPTAQGQTGKDKKTLVVPDVMVPNVGGLEQVAFINDQIEKMWQKNKLEHSERCDDYTFIRRATLDIIGRIPKIEEIQTYLKDPPNIRRSRLIEKLLATEEYSSNFANMWTTLMLTRSAGKMYREQMHLYLFDQFAKKDADWSKVVTEILTATGKTNENGAVNFILAHLGEENKKDTAENGRFEMVPVTSRTTKLFLGLQTQCTQCHDHPFHDKWKQYHFWGINAFFRQVDAPQGRPQIGMNNKQMQMNAQYSLKDDPSLNKPGLVQYENRKALIFYSNAKFVDGTKLPPDSKKTRREVLAELITHSPYFSKAFINRMWGHFFGIGFTKNGVADFGEHNPVSHPELLEKLADDWATKYGHNPKDLVRWICNSKAYGLSSVANTTNSSREAEPFFARMMLKPMTPEQLFESLTLATTPQLSTSTVEQKQKKEDWLKRLVSNFGDDEGEEASFNGTVVQALMLMNGKDINAAISDKNGAVEITLKQNEVMGGGKYALNHKNVINYLYLAALARTPTDAEMGKILDPKMYLLPGTKIGNAQEARTYWKAYYEDLLWAQVNSGEFFLNH